MLFVYHFQALIDERDIVWKINISNQFCGENIIKMKKYMGLST